MRAKVIFGQLTGAFQDYASGTISHHEFTHTLSHFTLYFVYLAIGEFVTQYICTVGFIYTGEHITQKIRERYLAAIIRQNIAFFDKLGAGEITTRITADTNLIQDGISEKIGLTLTAVSMFISAFVISFVKYWKLTLILSSTFFCILGVMAFGSTFIVRYNKHSLESYALGGTIVEEVIGSIRNATAFGTQDKLARQYDIHLKEAEKWGLKLKFVFAIMIAVMMCIVYLNYGLSFWQGSRYLVAGEMTLSDVLTIMFAIMIGAFALANVAPNGQAFTSSVAAASKIFSTIDRVSPIDPTSEAGEKFEHVEGTLELRKIKHIYPSRPEVVIIEDFNLVVPAGKTTALVGASGSGKSTIIGLVERFYDPVGGQVFLDGREITNLNLRWLRQQISLVSQEPVLFSTSIFRNIQQGLIGTKYENADLEVQRELITGAAKMANAHNFVVGLPDGYETKVGERGFLLSGGQKQRVAIARAVVSDPKILLLDEATSALDTKSEGVVQAALDVAAKGRTTIVIAHRLSTIKTADNIVVMSEGRIVEQGSHDQLLEMKGAYFDLVGAQRISAENEEKNAEKNARIGETEEKLFKSSSIYETADSKSPIPDPDTQEKLDRTVSGKSVSSAALQSKKLDPARTYSLWTLIKLVGSFNKKETNIMLIGLLFSVLAGAGNPVQSVFFAKAIVSLSVPPSQYNVLRHDANFWSLMYLMLAIVQFLSYAGQGIAFGICAEYLVHRARDKAFRAILRQDIGFFDREENAAGALTSYLSTQTTELAGISGVTLGTILNVSTTLVAAVALSLAIGWKLTLVCASTMPVLLACGYYRFWILGHFISRAKKAYEGSASYACEATSAIRTVASLTRENDVWEHYHQSLVLQGRRSLRSTLLSSILYAASQSLMLLCNALGFWYGGTLIASREYSSEQFFLCFTAIIFGAQSAGIIYYFALCSTPSSRLLINKAPYSHFPLIWERPRTRRDGSRNFLIDGQKLTHGQSTVSQSRMLKVQSSFEMFTLDIPAGLNSQSYEV